MGLIEALSTPVPKHSPQETHRRKKEVDLLFESWSLEGLSARTPVLLHGPPELHVSEIPTDCSALCRPREKPRKSRKAAFRVRTEGQALHTTYSPKR